MSAKYIILTAAWLLILVQTYIYSKIKLRGKSTAYTVAKLSGGAVFTLTGALSLLFSCSFFQLSMLGAFLLSMLGDYFLALPEGHGRLKFGIASFSMAHVVFLASFILYGGFFLWQLLAYLALFLVFILSLRICDFNFRSMKPFVIAYTALVTLMAVQACTLPFAGILPRLPSILIAVGGVLFLISDCIWSLYGFSRRFNSGALKVANVYTYFFAQLLMASGVLLMA